MKYSKTIFWGAIFALLFGLGYIQARHPGILSAHLFKQNVRPLILTNINDFKSFLDQFPQYETQLELESEKLRALAITSPGPFIILTSREITHQWAQENLVTKIDSNFFNNYISPDFATEQNTTVPLFWKYEDKKIEIFDFIIPETTPDQDESIKVIEVILKSHHYNHFIKNSPYRSTLLRTNKDGLSIEKRPEYLRNLPLKKGTDEVGIDPQPIRR